MEKRFKLNRLFVSLMILGCTFGFVACDDDDDSPVVPATKDAWGEFKGKMQVFPLTPTPALTSAAEAGTDVAATVKNDTVYFENFPITDLVASLVPEESVEGIVKAIGDVKYKIGYKAALNAAQDSVYMTFDPKPLKIAVPMGEESTLAVEVTVAAMDKGSYELSSKNLKFDVKADKVTVNETDFPAFPASVFKFVMKKDK